MYEIWNQFHILVKTGLISLEYKSWDLNLERLISFEKSISETLEITQTNTWSLQPFRNKLKIWPHHAVTIATMCWMYL